MPEVRLGDLLVSLYDLLGWGLSEIGLYPSVVSILQKLVAAFILTNFCLLTPLLTFWLERKVSARFQDRLGPNRVGPFGLFQGFADIVKLITKEDITPAGADKTVFNIGPVIAVASVVGIWAVIPFTSTMVGTDINVGILYSVAVGAIGTLAIMMGGWASNNKYALLGSFRTVSQLVSYEVPMIIALLIPTLLAGSMSMNTIVQEQQVWFVVAAPIAALLFLISSIAEVGRAPFDLLEAESEIVAGFHVEYTGMKFGVWMLAEFLHAFTICAITAVVFLGGWRGPWVDQYPLLGVVYFLIKTYFVSMIMLWIRVTVPRVRIDQMNDLNWKFLVPLSLVALVVTALVDKSIPVGFSAGSRSLILFLANMVIVVATLLVLRGVSRKEQAAQSDLQTEVNSI
ncbi:MAG TPA: NADH-quinone oxidoreductase subunit NuoH [Anaerolineales bacterium]|nr:NADH-quinone oxidoreductase subunit NuoH [Anaerolineales bacterium]